MGRGVRVRAGELWGKGSCQRRGSLEGAHGRPLAKVGDATGDPERLELMQLTTILCPPKSPLPCGLYPVLGWGVAFPTVLLQGL